MDVKRLVGAAAIATGIGLSVLPWGVGRVDAAPSDPPPPCLDCPPGPGGPGAAPPGSPNNPAIVDPGNPSRIIPPVGGGATSGGRVVEQPH
jgi:hypothetical protein